MKHELARALRTREVDVAVIGAGGTGSQVLTALAQLDHALRALRMPGLAVTVYDPDTVSHANVGRQMFYPADVGQYKCEVLVHRINMAMGTRWRAVPEKLAPSHSLKVDILIGCVDTRAARYAIMRSLERGIMREGSSYWLDFGNSKDMGQIVLGQVTGSSQKVNREKKLPHVGELFPEAINPELDSDDDGPSCSLAEALEKQSLFINRAVTVHGMNLLWELFRHGEIETHGAIVNLKTGMVRPIPVDPCYWARLGYGKVKKKVRLKDFRQPRQAATTGQPA